MRIDALAQLGARHLPGLGDAGQLVGMVSDRDLRFLRGPWTTEGALARALRVAVAEVIDAMLEAGVGAIPVVDEHTDALVGIVSHVDVLRAVRDDLVAPGERS